jgi:hypothetical protein
MKFKDINHNSDLIHLRQTSCRIRMCYQNLYHFININNNNGQKCINYYYIARAQDKKYTYWYRIHLIVNCV